MLNNEEKNKLEYLLSIATDEEVEQAIKKSENTKKLAMRILILSMITSGSDEVYKKLIQQDRGA